jgi:hypothetical protein
MRIIVVSGALALAALLLIAGGLSHRTEDPDPEVPEAIVALLPQPGAVALRQDEIGAELQPFLTGFVEIDGRTIPLDEIETLELGISRRVTFKPGELPDGQAKTIRELEPGRHTATIYWWPATEDAPTSAELADTERYSWSFSVG